MELVERSHPLGVAFGQVVVHRDQVHALSGQRIEEYGERRHERLALARRHFGDVAFAFAFAELLGGALLAARQHHAAEELAVVVDHVPLHVVAACHPVIGVHGLVALDGNEVFRRGQLAVEVVGRHCDRVVLREAARRVLHDGEGLGQDFVELVLDPVVDALGRLVDLLRDFLLLLERRLGQFEPCFQLDDAGFVRGDVVGDLLFEPLAAGAQLVVREGLDRGVDSLDLLDVRLDLFAVFFGLGAENGFDYACKNIHISVCCFFGLDSKSCKDTYFLRFINSRRGFLRSRPAAAEPRDSRCATSRR